MTVYDGSGKNANVVAQEDWPFSVRSEGDVYRVTLNYGAELDPKTDKYYISMTVNNVESARVALPIKMGAVKLAQSTKTVSLLKNDKNSSASLTISAAEDKWALNAIDWGRTQTAFISQTDRKGDPFFKLSCDGTGVCIIGYAGNNFLSAKNGTVKIPVFFKGNGSSTPNATITVSMRIV